MKRDKLWTPNSDSVSSSSGYVSSMPAQILSLTLKEGDFVEKGQLLLTMESMKMEIKITANSNGFVTYFVKEGQVIPEGTVLLDISEKEKK